MTRTAQLHISEKLIRLFADGDKQYLVKFAGYDGYYDVSRDIFDRLLTEQNLYGTVENDRINVDELQIPFTQYPPERHILDVYFTEPSAAELDPFTRSVKVRFGAAFVILIFTVQMFLLATGGFYGLHMPALVAGMAGLLTSSYLLVSAYRKRKFMRYAKTQVQLRIITDKITEEMFRHRTDSPAPTDKRHYLVSADARYTVGYDVYKQCRVGGKAEVSSIRGNTRVRPFTSS